MLKARIITALILVSVLLPCLFFLPQSVWALVAALVAGVAAWEWGGLMRWRSAGCYRLGIATALSCSGLSLLFPSLVELGQPDLMLPVYGMATAFWLLVVPLWLARKWTIAGLPGILTGALVIVPTWLALTQLRLLGPEVLLAILALVWVADVAAYFFGKTFGKNKLAPSISPGKTWEGALGACVTVVCYGLVLRGFFAASTVSPLVWVAGLVLVTAVSVMGDLFESLLKRQAGLKDSSHVLPGHGGVLDRIDSLTSTLPVVALLWLLSSLHQAS